MRRLILLTAFVSVPVVAGDVYKCKGPKGEVTFTNIKCPEHTATERYATYQPEPEPVAEPAATAAVEAAPSFGNVSSSDATKPPAVSGVSAPALPSTDAPTMPFQQPSDPSDQPVAAASTNVPAGYKCSDGQNIWLQSTPCPAATTRTSPDLGESPSAVTEPVTASTAAQPTPAIAQASSSQGALCDQLIAQVSSPQHRNAGAGTDELNKLLAANGCNR